MKRPGLTRPRPLRNFNDDDDTDPRAIGGSRDSANILKRGDEALRACDTIQG
jgi:hypothetical protein